MFFYLKSDKTELHHAGGRLLSQELSSAPQCLHRTLQGSEELSASTIKEVLSELAGRPAAAFSETPSVPNSNTCCSSKCPHTQVTQKASDTPSVHAGRMTCQTTRQDDLPGALLRFLESAPPQQERHVPHSKSQSSEPKETLW